MGKNRLIFGDCLDVLRKTQDKSIDLIYIDPPFNSKRNYNILYEDVVGENAKAQKEAFRDTWSNIDYQDTLEELKDTDLDLYNFLDNLNKVGIQFNMISYLVVMSARLIHMQRVLKDTGTFYLHCDPTMSHYLKIVCDLIFGRKNFRNEILWCYRGAGYPKKDFGHRHDIIFRYSKTDKYTFNVDDVREEYAEATKERFSHYIGNVRGEQDYGTQQLNPKGKHPDDWWEIQPIPPSSKARLGYPTQKPEELLRKIIKASTNEGETVADFFCGCGTSIKVAEELNRNWIGVDISHLAIQLNTKRLVDSFGKEIRDTFEVDGFPKDIASAKELATKVDEGRIKFQDWIIEVLLGSISNPKKTADGGWDGHFTFKVDPNEEKGKKDLGLIEVKSGKVNVKNLREFINVVDKQDASIGVFVCFKEYVTSAMQKEAKQAGYYRKESFGTTYDKIQILTVENLLDGVQPKYPKSIDSTFKSAPKHSKKDQSEQASLDLEDPN